MVGYLRGDAQIVLGLDNQAPPRPDQARRGQRRVLCERELLGGARKVGDAGEDEGPFHHGRPVIDLLCQHRIPSRM